MTVPGVFLFSVLTQTPISAPVTQITKMSKGIHSFHRALQLLTAIEAFGFSRTLRATGHCIG